MSRPLLPPFDRASAIEKVRLAEDGWNSRNPEKVAAAYTDRRFLWPQGRRPDDHPGLSDLGL